MVNKVDVDTFEFVMLIRRHIFHHVSLITGREQNVIEQVQRARVHFLRNDVELGTKSSFLV